MQNYQRFLAKRCSGHGGCRRADGSSNDPGCASWQQESEPASPSLRLPPVWEHLWRVEREMVAMGALHSCGQEPSP